MKPTLSAFLCSLFLMVTIPSQAQWRCGIKNVVHPLYNIDCILEFTGDVTVSRDVSVEIRLKKKGSVRDYLKKTVSLGIGEQQWFHVPMKVEADQYEYEVEVLDPLTMETSSLARGEPLLVNSAGVLSLSDIFISAMNNADSAFQQPLLVENLSSGFDSLFYFMKVVSTRNMMINSNAFFYENARESRAGRSETQVYASLQEKSSSYSLLANQETVISGYLLTSELTEGDYLLDITIAGGGGDALQETASFRVGSNIRQIIFSNLDDAIRKMTFILPESSVNELLDNPSEDARRIEFLEAWEDLYHEEADFEMEKYYLRLEEVEQKFADSRPGWQTDRGKIYMQYGEPGRIDDISKGGISYRRWIYPQWSMMFLFEERNQTFLLVE